MIQWYYFGWALLFVFCRGLGTLDCQLQPSLGKDFGNHWCKIYLLNCTVLGLRSRGAIALQTLNLKP